MGKEQKVHRWNSLSYLTHEPGEESVALIGDDEEFGQSRKRPRETKLVSETDPAEGVASLSLVCSWISPDMENWTRYFSSREWVKSRPASWPMRPLTAQAQPLVGMWRFIQEAQGVE